MGAIIAGEFLMQNLKIMIAFQMKRKDKAYGERKVQSWAA